MKYHYQRGIVEKDKKGHVKSWVGFFAVFGVLLYAGFMFAVLNFNGWPLSDIADTARIVKTTKPSNQKVLIPAINLTANSASVKVNGDPTYSDVTVSGSSFGFGVTPSSVRQASPFYNIDQLKEGDEVFLDNEGTRYVYKVTDSIDEEDQKLTIKTEQKSVVAKTIGTIAWENGKPRLESF